MKIVLSHALTTLALLIAAAPAYGFRVPAEDITGSLPRGTGSVSSFDLKATIIEITATDKTKAQTANQTSRDWIIVKIQNDTNNVQKDANCPETDGSPFYMEFDKEPEEIQNDDGTFNYSYDLTVHECPGDTDALDKILSGQTELLVNVGASVGEENFDPVAKTIKKSLFIIADKPTFTAEAVVGSNKRVVVFWNVPSGKLKTRSDTAGAAGDDVTPGQMHVVAIAADGAPGTLPSRTFDPTQAADPEATTDCTFTAQAGDCVSCPDANTYVDFEALTVAKRSAAVSDGSAAIDGLENDKTYFTFMQYEPGGPASQCVPAQPSPNFTLTELNGEGDAKVVDVRCFIATAAYGSPLHERLAIFREFRDEVLLTSEWGKVLVDAYYEHSPVLADFIANHPKLRDLTRQMLEGVAWLLETLRHPEQS